MTGAEHKERMGAHFVRHRHIRLGGDGGLLGSAGVPLHYVFQLSS